MFMILRALISIVVFAGLFILSFPEVIWSQSNYVINDFTFYPIPNTPRPAKGVPYIDPVFHTEIVRITDSPTETGSAWANPGYPKHDIENADGTMLLIQSRGGSGWHIYNANPPYNKIKDIPIALINRGVAIDARWDATDPNILYFQRYGMRRYNVLTDECETLHVFSEDFPPRPGELYPKFGQTLQEEGNSSDDSRYWAFNIYGQDLNPVTNKVFYYSGAIAVYDKDFYRKNNGKIISVLPKERYPNTGVDAAYPLTNPGFVSISPSGKYIWTGDRHRIFSWDFDTTKYKNLGASGHADMGFSKEGREVVVCGNRYYKGGVDLGIWVTMIDIETGEKTPLAPVGDSHYHISANGHLKPGWCVVSVYGPTAPALPTMWAQHSVYLVEMSKRVPSPDLNNHTRVWRIAHTHTKKVSYADDPFAKMNRKGTKVWFGSGWGKSYTESGGQYDVYQINLPSTWYQDLMGNLPPTASISATPLSGKPPLTVNFTGSGRDTDGSVVSYSWNFGDGATSNQQTTSHTYEIPGSFTATFKVTDNKGTTGSANVTINVLKSDTTPPAPPKGLKIVSP